jgi:hypothetical protein
MLDAQLARHGSPLSARRGSVNSPFFFADPSPDAANAATRFYRAVPTPGEGFLAGFALAVSIQTTTGGNRGNRDSSKASRPGNSVWTIHHSVSLLPAQKTSFGPIFASVVSVLSCSIAWIRFSATETRARFRREAGQQ